MTTTKTLTGDASPLTEEYCETQLNEAELLALVRVGDELACERFVRQFGGPMLTVARRFLRCEHEAADAVQEAFLSALRALDTFKEGSKVSTWLHRIVVNVCLMKLRSQRGKTPVSIESLLPAFDESGRHERPVARWPDSTEQVSAAELRVHVRACIDQLPEPYRAVVLLRDIEELDTDETALQLGISTANVKTRLHRARLALRTLLDPYIRDDYEDAA